MKKYTILLVVLGLMAANTGAQFPIKIPKITTPKVEAPKTNSPSSPSSPINTSQPKLSAGRLSDNPMFGVALNRQMVMDDAYTHFDAEAITKYAGVIYKSKEVGWYLKSQLRIMGTFPARSAFRIIVKKNGKELGMVRCEGSIYRKDLDPSLRSESAKSRRRTTHDDYMNTRVRCLDETQAIKEIGKLDVEIYFIDGDTDKETLVRKHVIDVHEGTNVKGNPGSHTADTSTFYIQRHAEAAVAVAYYYAPAWDKDSYFRSPQNTNDTTIYGTLHILTSYSRIGTSQLDRVPRYARCSVNGQKITFADDRVTGVVGFGGDSGFYSDRNAPKYKTQGTAYRESIAFEGMAYGMPLFTGDAEQDVKPGSVKLETYPGKWECSVLANGETIRTFRWEIGSDGRIVPHPEQLNGNINLYNNAFLIDVEIPARGSFLDGRLIPMPELGMFYGIPWTTAEGKAQAARVPKVGNPYPVSSDKQK
ncbi:MAG: hypothetical protein WBO10_00160 [Pyrinomonadaceae bacterium]